MNAVAFRGALLALCALLAGACVNPAPDDGAVELRSDEERTLYAMGLALAFNNRGLHLLDLTPREAAILREGLMDGTLERELQVEISDYESKFRPFLQQRAQEVATRERAAAADFLAAAAAEEGAVRLPSGTVLRILEQGDEAAGEIPLSAVVKLRVEGRRRDGKVFTKTEEGEPPEVVRMNGLIPCWREALQQASVGTKLEVTCHPDTAFGDEGSIPSVKPGAAIAFQLEVVEVIDRK